MHSLKEAKKLIDEHNVVFAIFPEGERVLIKGQDLLSRIIETKQGHQARVAMIQCRNHVMARALQRHAVLS
jgi:hypothetical protein